MKATWGQSRRAERSGVDPSVWVRQQRIFRLGQLALATGLALAASIALFAQGAVVGGAVLLVIAMLIGGGSFVAFGRRRGLPPGGAEGR